MLAAHPRQEDRLRAAVIERLMCDLAVDVGRIAAESGRDPEDFGRELDAIDRMAEDGIVSRDGYRVSVPEEARPFFRRLRLLRDKARAENLLLGAALSMGMSHDLEVAIEEGATLVRVGTALFGERGAAAGAET